MAISPERLERYSDFVIIHSVNGVYDSEKGLGGLLTTLVPDAKPVVLAAMFPEEIYFSAGQLHRDVRTWLENRGVSGEVFPIGQAAAWQYCEQRKSQEIGGSLVKLGAVVRQAQMVSGWGEYRIGYIKSAAGTELAVPLMPYAVEFVDKAEQSGILYQYDSMWRLLGFASSLNDRRRPSAVFKVIEFLIQNQKVYRSTDIKEGLEGQINRTTIFEILNNLGQAGIIDYDSPDRYVKGQKAKGYTQSRASANDLTRMFYDLVLLPVEEVADTLTPPPAKPLEARKLTQFLQNYQEERSNIGPLGGEEVREGIIDILSSTEGLVKLSLLLEKYRERHDRRLGKKTLMYHLNELIKQRMVKKNEKGYYEFIPGSV
ncbi:hypothetical protein HY384_03375 [Candidatus Daviesbacteria bacterium]|nr:hypothetical protein [Candidatus Daviesbacteria bacterium]